MAAAPAVAQQASPRFCLRLWLYGCETGVLRTHGAQIPLFPYRCTRGFCGSHDMFFPRFFAACDICFRRSGAEGFSPGLFAKRPLSYAAAPISARSAFHVTVPRRSACTRTVLRVRRPARSGGGRAFLTGPASAAQHGGRARGRAAGKPALHRPASLHVLRLARLHFSFRRHLLVS